MSHPPVEFPLYGLDDAWPGPRWLDFMAGELDGPVWAVWLGHGQSRFPRPPGPWVLVGTTPTEMACEVQVGDDPWQGPAGDVLLPLVNLAKPTLSVDEERRYGQATLRFIEERVATPTAWAEVSWSVDDQPEMATVTSWAGAWAGFTKAISRPVVIEVVGFGLEPSEVRLEARASRDYHFDSGLPLVFPDVLNRSQESAFGAGLPDRPAWTRHKDHERLLTT